VPHWQCREQLLLVHQSGARTGRNVVDEVGVHFPRSANQHWGYYQHWRYYQAEGGSQCTVLRASAQ
jgi:hypothetical protein